MSLQDEIEALYAQDPSALNRAKALQHFNEFKFFLNRGDIRAAERVGEMWTVHEWVKKGIVLGFRLGVLTEVPSGGTFRFFDKSTYPLRHTHPEEGIRLVPGGSSIRDGVYLGRGVICMPPMFINVGAYIDADTMIDSHVLVGSCAQVGKRVHIGAGTQLGGVLEPVGSLPVIIEDDVLVGGNCGIFEGAIVRRGAVLGAGVTLTGSTPLYDVVNRTVYRRHSGRPLTIPERAVVVPGSRPIDDAWARAEHLSVATPVIIKYRDEITAGATALEADLR